MKNLKLIGVVSENGDWIGNVCRNFVRILIIEDIMDNNIKGNLLLNYVRKKVLLLNIR